MKLRVCVDYNTMMADPQERVRINTVVQPRLLELLSPGLPLILFDGDNLEVDAVAEFEIFSGTPYWFGVPDWSTRRDLPQMSADEIDQIDGTWKPD